MLFPSSSFLMIRPPPPSTLFPYTTLFRSVLARSRRPPPTATALRGPAGGTVPRRSAASTLSPGRFRRSEEHTSELQSHHDLVCRLLLEKKKKNTKTERDHDNTQTHILTTI